MKYIRRASEQRVRILTAITLLISTAVTFLQIHEPRGGLFGVHINSLGEEHLLLVMLLSIGSALILAQGLFRGRILAHRIVLLLSLLFGFGALLTGPTFGTVIDTLLCGSLLFVLIDYAYAFNIHPNRHILIRNLIVILLATIGLWLTGARVMTVTNFNAHTFSESMELSALWMAGGRLDQLARLTPLSESLLSIALVIWALYLLRTIFVVILSADDWELVRRERAWITRLLLKRSRRSQKDY